MKSKLLTVVLLVFAIGQANAQFSFKSMRGAPSTNDIETNNQEELKKIIDSVSVKGVTNFSEITKIASEKGILIINDLKSETTWFPAFGSLEEKSKYSIRFFEGETDNQKIFQNNSVLYNPNLKSMTLSSEVINDYFGGFRVGAGFQLNSTVDDENLTPEEADRDQLISSLQNSGGNVFLNARFPILSYEGKTNDHGIKMNFFHNTGFELTKFNQADDNFMMTNMTGVVVGGFAKGFKGNIFLFAQAKAGLIYGNSKFKEILSVDHNVGNVIPITHFEIGMSFSDVYTIKADIYPIGNFIKNNFPTTISFVITPKKDNVK